MLPMDRFNYHRMIQNALRRVVHTALSEVVEHGLEGEHHFYIMVDTTHPGVEISPTLRRRFPETITIVLEHQFWELEVDDEGFAVTLTFGRVPERLRVPFDSIQAVSDPSANFRLQFDQTPTGDAAESNTKPTAVATAYESPESATESPTASTSQSETKTEPALATGTFPRRQPTDSEEGSPSENPRATGQVIQIDEFRRK